MEIQEIHGSNRCVYGIDRILPELRRRGERCGRERVRRLMKTAGIRGKMRRKRRVLTTDSRHDNPIAPDLVQRHFAAAGPNRIWVSDITYIRIARGWMYLCIVLDLYSRKVVGWSMSRTPDSELTARAMEMSLLHRTPDPGLILHSDRGVQYTSKRFRGLLMAHGVMQSMSRRGDCYDNSCAESFFATLKRELAAGVFWSQEEAEQEIFDYIEVFYNRERSHSYLGYVSPEEFEKWTVA